MSDIIQSNETLLSYLKTGQKFPVINALPFESWKACLIKNYFEIDTFPYAKEVSNVDLQIGANNNYYLLPHCKLHLCGLHQLRTVAYSGATPLARETQ